MVDAELYFEVPVWRDLEADGAAAYEPVITGPFKFDVTVPHSASAAVEIFASRNPQSVPQEIKDAFDSKLGLCVYVSNGDPRLEHEQVSATYMVDSRGRLLFNPDNTVENYQLSALEASIAAGFIEVDSLKLVATPMGGRGAGGFWTDLAMWLLDHSVDIGLDAAAWTAVRIWRVATARIRNSRRDKDARKLAQEWAASNIEYPYHLRAFLELRPQWTLEDLKLRLGLSRRSGRQLFRALGYVEDAGGNWRLGTDRRSKKRRQRWMDDENEMDW